MVAPEPQKTFGAGLVEVKEVGKSTRRDHSMLNFSNYFPLNKYIFLFNIGRSFDLLESGGDSGGR